MSVRGEQFWLDATRAAQLRPRARPRYTLTPSIVLRNGQPFDPAADIRGTDDPARGVADSLAQLEGVREAAVADCREAGRQVGNDLVGLGAAGLAVAEEPVVRQREQEMQIFHLGDLPK